MKNNKTLNGGEFMDNHQEARLERQREYNRDYYKRNKEKVKASRKNRYTYLQRAKYQLAYWTKKVQELEGAKDEQL